MKGPPAPPAPHPTAVDALRAAAGHPSGTTFVGLREEEVRLGWDEVQSRASRVAGALVDLGIRPGDRVALVLRTEPAFLDVFFGALLAGAVPVPLYPPVRLGRMEEYLGATARMLRVSGARVVVASGAVRRLLGEAVAGARPELGCREAGWLLARGRPAEPASPAPTDLALVQFSSGSTVDPKPVALTHANLMAQVGALMALVRPTDRDCLVSWLPLYHDMGLIGCLLGAASYPGPLVLIAPEHFLARPSLWLRAIARHRGTISAAPHFAYAYAEQRVRDEDLAGLDLASWRVALDGAEPVTAPPLRRFADRFERFGLDRRALMPVYGLSEAALAVTFAPPRPEVRTLRVGTAALGARIEAGEREVISVGAPVPGVEVEIRGKGGEALAERHLGRIHVRGPSVMQGYLGDPEATGRVLRDGWLDTGDLGFADGGELFVHGRAKDLVIVRGANHAPEEFESCLDGIAGLRTGCAVALGYLPPGADGEELLLLAELPRKAAATRTERLEEAIRTAVLERTGVRPHQIRLLPPGTLPRTSSGKMRRAEALRRFHAGELAPPAGTGGMALARALARSALAYARARREPGPERG